MIHCRDTGFSYVPLRSANFSSSRQLALGWSRTPISASAVVNSISDVPFTPLGFSYYFSRHYGTSQLRTVLQLAKDLGRFIEDSQPLLLSAFQHLPPYYSAIVEVLSYMWSQKDNGFVLVVVTLHRLGSALRQKVASTQISPSPGCI